MSTSSTTSGHENNDNILTIISNLETEKSDLVTHIEQVQYKYQTLKRRTEVVRTELASVKKLFAEKDFRLSSVKKRGDLQQSCYNNLQVTLETSQNKLQKLAVLTKEEANKRFTLIGQFEEKMVHLCDQLSTQNLCASLDRVDLNLNKSTLRDKEISQKLAEARFELVKLSGRKEIMKSASASCKLKFLMNTIGDTMNMDQCGGHGDDGVPAESRSETELERPNLHLPFPRDDMLLPTSS